MKIIVKLPMKHLKFYCGGKQEKSFKQVLKTLI